MQQSHFYIRISYKKKDKILKQQNSFHLMISKIHR